MKIFIDSGHNHSGADIGAQGNGLKEQDITYQIGQKVGAMLKSQGILVKYSRNAITDNIGNTLTESINGRVKMANDWKADLFISIHCNASANSSANGTETLVYTDKSAAYLLANMINSNLVKLGLTHRGVKIRTDLGVLRNTTMPSILVEVGFITNPSDAVFLAHRQDDIVQAICNGIFEYTGIETEETEMIYNYIDENMPQWARPTIQKLVDKGFLKGNEKGELGLNDTMLKLLVINDRVGLYD